MKLYEAYGSAVDIDSTKDKMELLLSIKFERHESSYYGEYYLSKHKYKGRNLKIVNNIDLLDGMPLEEGGYTVILYIDCIVSDANETIAISKYFTLISSEIL